MKPEDFTMQATGELLRIDRGWAFSPNPLPPEIKWDNDLVSSFGTAQAAIGQLRGHCDWLPNPRLFTTAFLNREAVLSSKIEGSRAVLEDVMAFAAQAEPGASAVDMGSVEEVYNYALALEHGIKLLETLPISRRLISELHFVLLDGVRGQQWPAGEFREIQNLIGTVSDTADSARFVPPPPGEVLQRGLDNIEAFANADLGIPALLQIALIHYQFETLHPFVDGNGRVGRLLISLLMIEKGLLSQPLLYLSAFFERNRKQYQQYLLDVSQRGAWNQWFQFFLLAVTEESRDAITRSTALQNLRERYRSEVQAKTSSGSLLSAVDQIFVEPVFNTRGLSKAIGVTIPATRHNIEQLLEFGIIREITGLKRNQLFRADEVLAIVERPSNSAQT